MAAVLGLDAALFYQTDGVAGSAGWVELTNVKDVTLNLETSDADITTRANNGWRATKAALKDASVEFQMVWDKTEAGFNVIKDAYLNATALGLRIFDAATSGSGLEADFTISSFSRSEPLEEALTVSVTAKVTFVATSPEWVE